MENSQPDQALPFISYKENQGFVLTKEAEDFLHSLAEKKLGVISIVGKYRTGKSFFVNRVLLNRQNNGFNVGPTINPCTKGLWLWNRTLKAENQDYDDMEVILIDTEGFGGMDENANHDSRIFLFSLLLSSFFIYNSVGSIDETALQNLSMIINMAKEIQIKSKNANVDENEIAQYFPSFLWVVRDFALRLVDPNGNPLNSKEYLESALNPIKGVSDAVESKNRVRRLLKHFFRDRDCCTLVRPLENEKDLQKLNSMKDDDLRPEFVDEIKRLRKKIFKRVKPKTLNGKVFTGAMLAEICKAYLTAINSGGVPNIENAWNYLCKQESQKALNECVENIERKLQDKIRDGPINQDDLNKIRKQLKQEIRTQFKKKAMGNEEEQKLALEELSKHFGDYYKKFKEKNNLEWKQIFDDWIKENSQLEENLKKDAYHNYAEFQLDYEKLKDLYDTNAQIYYKKEKKWKEYAEKILSFAGQSMTKRIEQENFIQSKRIVQKLEMAENELAEKKKEVEAERISMLNRLQELERERAIIKAQESNNAEKYDIIKNEKEKCEKLYTEGINAAKEREEKLEREYKEKLSQIESKFELNKTENFQLSSNYDKKLALLEQELSFTKRDNDSLNHKMELYDNENKKLKSDIISLQASLEKAKQKATEVELAKDKEIESLKLELEKKLYDLQHETERRKDGAKMNAEWITEKGHLENQINFLKSQLEENRRLHDTLLKALEQGLNHNDNENANELVEANRNLSGAVEKMEIRCKILEEKIEKLKKFKKMIKNSICLQCIHCSKFISNNIFLQHMTNCQNLHPSMHQAANPVLNTYSMGTGINIMPNNNLMTSPQMMNIPTNNQFQQWGSSFSQAFPQAQVQSASQPQLTNLNHGNSSSNYQGSTTNSNTNIDANTLQISINQTMVKENPDSQDSKLYTEYLIQMIYENTKWSVSRKYKLFSELNRNLITKFPGLKFPESSSVLANCNNMNYINSKRPTVIEERRKGLQRYLRDLAKIDLVRNSSPFKKFLELDKINERVETITNPPGKNLKLISNPIAQSNSSIMSFIDQDDKRSVRAFLSSDRKITEEEYTLMYKEATNSNQVGNYIDQNQNYISNDEKELAMQDFSVKIDKRVFTQSPNSFLKNWQEGSQINKENNNPGKGKSGTSDQSYLFPVAKKEMGETTDINPRMTNIDVSVISAATNIDDNDKSLNLYKGDNLINGYFSGQNGVSPCKQRNHVEKYPNMNGNYAQAPFQKNTQYQSKGYNSEYGEAPSNKGAVQQRNMIGTSNNAHYEVNTYNSSHSPYSSVSNLNQALQNANNFTKGMNINDPKSINVNDKSIKVLKNIGLTSSPISPHQIRNVSNEKGIMNSKDQNTLGLQKYPSAMSGIHKN